MGLAGHMRALPLAVALGLMPFALLATVPVVAVAGVLGLGWMTGLVLVEVSCFAVPPLLAARAEGDARAALGLVRAPARALAGAALLGLSFWYLDAAFVARLFADRATESDRALAEAVAGGDPFVAKLLVIAILPAVCEELLVRGAIARAVASRAGMWTAVAASSAYFAVMHLSLARAAPTAILGAVLAVAALRSGSLVPAMLAHALNNGVVVVLAQPGMADAASAIDRHPGTATAVAAGASAAGLALLWTSRGR